ncbi:TA system toxin CbtA family protein [Yersinia kristensenii]|uniref:TA system toxin CbtA family protein n=1 Tax=Yersinia kristensenii TaxID=28152 RepID=UPI0005E5C1BD|nr:TA system toxin CbtA family protein [Yersinia kristensenii]CNG99838.1 ypjf toxin protein [Yersinia kristensenii]CNK01863.1 ypjf toxin protein [Yersinia kristensenii]
MKSRVTAQGALPMPVIYQQLLAFLLGHHYGLSLNDTPYHDEQAIAQQIEQGISVGDTINTLVEKYALVRIGRNGFSALAQDPMLSKGDIARARQAAGLWRAHFPPTLLYPTESLNPIPQRPLT